MGENARDRLDHDDHRLVEGVLSQLGTLGIGAFSSERLVFSDVARWPAVGPIISDEAYGRFSKARLRPFDRVVLAGDYTWWDARQMPYGVYAAIASGRRAASMVCDEAQGDLCTSFRPTPLAVSSVSGLSDRGPLFQRNMKDGTVAYYGLILQAEPDPALERYLLGEAEDGLWAYQQGYGVTSLDSALVMEGLLSTGRHSVFLNHSADRLVERFFDPDEGGFRTLPHGREGRAPYWRGVDCPATAFCGWLTHRIAPERYREIIHACAEYLRRKQLATGRWPGKWFPSETIPIYYAVRFLAEMGPEFDAACRRAGVWLPARQNRNGSWEESVVESAAAVLALCVLGGPEENILRGCAWIRDQATETGWPGEPILHYWFEEGRQRTGFHTRDLGRITTAWARLALNEAERRKGLS